MFIIALFPAGMAPPQCSHIELPVSNVPDAAAAAAVPDAADADAFL